MTKPIKTLISDLAEATLFNDEQISDLTEAICAAIDQVTAEGFINRRLSPDAIDTTFGKFHESTRKRLKGIVQRWNAASLVPTHPFYSAEKCQEAQQAREATARAQASHQALERQIGKLTQEKTELTREMGQLQTEIAQLTTASNLQTAAREAKEREFAEREKSFEDLKERLARAEAGKLESETTIQTLTSRLAQIEEEARQRQEALRQALEVTQNKLTEMEAAFKKEQAMAADLFAQVKKCEIEKSTVLAEHEKLKASYNFCQLTLNEYKTTFSDEAMDILRDMANGKAVTPNVLRVGLVLIALMQIQKADDKSLLKFFDRLDEELYSLYSEQTHELDRLRDICMSVLSKKFPQYEVDWDMRGQQYDEEVHRTDDNSGNTVLEVVEACIRSGETGKILRRAKVRTCLD